MLLVDLLQKLWKLIPPKYSSRSYLANEFRNNALTLGSEASVKF